MGEAYSAVADEASALYWNPAGLAQISGGSLIVMHAPYIDSSFYDYGACAQNLGSWGVFALGAQFLSYGSIPQTDQFGADAGSFNPTDMAISLGYAHALGRGSVGFSGKFIQSTILTSAQTEAMDFGFLSPGFWDNKLKLALVATNIGGQIKFEQEGADLPKTVKVGGRLKLFRSFILSFDGVVPNYNDPYVALGTEYGLPLSPGTQVAFRAGYNTRTLNDLDGLTSVSLGMGLILSRMSIDYAFLPLGSLGYTHRISLSCRWGEITREPVHHKEPEDRLYMKQKLHDQFIDEFEKQGGKP